MNYLEKKSTNKKYYIFIYCILSISLLINVYLILTASKRDSIVVKIDDSVVLTQNELNDLLNQSFKSNIINQKVNEHLLNLESENRSIDPPTDEELLEFKKLFPSLFTNEKNLLELYYIYNIFKEDINTNEIESFLQEQYGESNPNLYEINFYDTSNHELATNIQTMLEEGISKEDVELWFGIEFSAMYTASINDILVDDSEHNTEEDSSSNSNNTYSNGEVFHLMDEDGMHILFINDIFTLEDNEEHFSNLYFSHNYNAIKSNLFNTLKGVYTITYF